MEPSCRAAPPPQILSDLRSAISRISTEASTIVAAEETAVGAEKTAVGAEESTVLASQASVEASRPVFQAPPLSLHFDHATRYRDLLASLYDSLYDMYTQHKNPVAADFVGHVIAHLGRLTPSISILASSASDAVQTMRSEDIGNSTSNLTKKDWKKEAKQLRKQAKSVSFCYTSLATKAQTMLDNLNTACKEHESIKNNRAASCMHLEDRLRMIRRGLVETNTNLYQMSPLLNVAWHRRNCATTRLVFLKILAAAIPPLRKKLTNPLQKATYEVPVANDTLSQINRERISMKGRRKRFLAEYFSFARERNKERLALNIDEEQIEDKLGVVCRMKLIATQLNEAEALWLKVVKTFAIINAYYDHEEYRSKTVEIWHMVSVITRIYLLDHAESIRKMLTNIELKPTESENM